MAEIKEKSAAGAKAEKTIETSSHITVHPLYTGADLEGWDYDQRSRLSRTSFLTRAGCKPRCIAAASGPCGNTPAWATPKNPIAATNIC